MTEWQERFEALGVNVAAMTYDGVDKLAAFAEKEGVTYPVLSDQGAAYVNALGIRNEDYAEGHGAYGVAHPGIFLVDAAGEIRLKRAIAGYRDRPPFDELLAAVTELVSDGEGAAGDTASP